MLQNVRKEDYYSRLFEVNLVFEVNLSLRKRTHRLFNLHTWKGKNRSLVALGREGISWEVWKEKDQRIPQNSITSVQTWGEGQGEAGSPLTQWQRVVMLPVWHCARWVHIYSEETPLGLCLPTSVGSVDKHTRIVLFVKTVFEILWVYMCLFFSMCFICIWLFSFSQMGKKCIRFII